MKTKLLSAALFALSLSPFAAAQAVHALVSNGIKTVVEEVAPKTANVEFGTSSSIKKRIEAGEPFDVVIVTSDLVDDLIKQGKVAAAGRTDLAQAGIGVGVRKGAPKPEIGSTEAFKATLMKTKSITYAQDGASRTHLEKMFDKLGMTAMLKPKTFMQQGSVNSNAKVADGSVEMIFTLQSEILSAPGVDLVGPLPADLQTYLKFTAGVSPGSKNADGTKAFIKMLTGPAIKPVLKAKGMEAVK